MHEIPENELPDEPIPGDEHAAGEAPGRTPGNLPLSNEELVSAYLDGELQGPALARAERLLQERPEYRQLLEDLRGQRAALAALPRVELERDFYQRVLRRAEREMLSAPAEADPSAAATLTATTLPAVTLPLPESGSPAAAAGAQGACPPELGSQPPGTDQASSAAPASGTANAMGMSRGMPPTASMTASECVPGPTDQTASSQPPSYSPSREEMGSALMAAQIELSAASRVRRLLSRGAAVLAGLAALLIVGLFLKSNWNDLQLAQGPEALRSSSEKGLEVGGLEGAKSPLAGSASFAGDGHEPALRGEAVPALSEQAVPGSMEQAVPGSMEQAVPRPMAPAGDAASGTAAPEVSGADGLPARRGARRQSGAPQDGSGAGSQALPTDDSRAAAGARAMVSFGGQHGDEGAALAHAASSDALVVHCEVAPDGQSLQAFQQILQAADIAWSESNSGQLEHLVRKLANLLPPQPDDPQKVAADEQSGERDKAPDAQSSLKSQELRAQAQRAQQERQMLAKAAPAFEVWYVVAPPERVAAVLEAMAQRPDIFRNASVLPAGSGAVPLAEWQATPANAGRTEADLPTGPLPVEKQSVGNNNAKPDKRLPGAPVASGKGSPTRKFAKAGEDDAQDDGQPAAEEGESAGEPASAGTAEAGGASDDGSAGSLKNLAESEPGGTVAGGRGGMADTAQQGGFDGGDLAMGYAVRWNMDAPDLAIALQQLLARLGSLLGQLPAGEADGPQPPAAALPDADEQKSEPQNAGTREREAPSGPDDAVETGDAPRENTPTDAPAPEAENAAVRRKAASTVAASSAAEAKQSRGRQGPGHRAGQAKKKLDGAAGGEAQQGQAAGEEQPPSDPAAEAAQNLPLLPGADAADRNMAAPADGAGEPDFTEQDGERTAYRQVLFVLRLVAAEPAAADGAD